MLTALLLTALLLGLVLLGLVLLGLVLLGPVLLGRGWLVLLLLEGFVTSSLERSFLCLRATSCSASETANEKSTSSTSRKRVALVQEERYGFL